MKKLFLVSAIAVGLPFCMISIQAQTNQTQLNQIELLKQYAGSWKCELSKDTIEYIDSKSYGTGLYIEQSIVTKGKILSEGKQLYGYDKQLDKFIVAAVNKGSDMQLTVLWFTTKNICAVYFYRDISAIEKASFRAEIEFQSPDIFALKMILDNKILSTNTFIRIKK